MEERQVPQQNITTIQGTDYRDNYANSIQISVSIWDFFLTFGNIKHNEKQEMTILNFQGMYISPQQAKAFSNILRQNIKNYEDTFGEIKLNPKDQVTQ
jgi:hypothetical protein